MASVVRTSDHAVCDGDGVGMSVVGAAVLGAAVTGDGVAVMCRGVSMSVPHLHTFLYIWWSARL